MFEFESETKWRNNAIWRAHERAQTRGILAYSIAQSDLGQLRERLFYKERLREMLEEYLYEFAFNARRAIECADSESPGAVAEARSFSFARGRVRFRGPGIEGELPLCQQDFWWTVNRVVHSRATVVLPHAIEVQEENEEWRAYGGELTVFALRSDRDEEGVYNFVRVEDFVAGYLTEMGDLVEAVTNSLSLSELRVKPSDASREESS